MINIRAVCKVFLDFVYDNDMIPTGIKNILDRNQSEWDFRLICKLLRYQNEFKNKSEDEREMAEYISVNHPFDHNNENFKQWSNHPNRIRLMDIKRQADTFFHNVSQYEEADKWFIEKIVDMIKLYPNIDAGNYLRNIEKIMGDAILGNIGKVSETNNDKKGINSDDPKTTRNVNIEKDMTNKRYIVAYYFSNYEHNDIYPDLNQTEAIEKAANALETTYYNLRQMRDQFDAHYRNIPFEDRKSRKALGRRIGYVGKLASTMQRIKDEYDAKSKEEIILIVKEILKINR